MMPEWLARRAFLTPDAPALSFRGRWWTFADLNGAAERAAAMLLKVLSEVSAINDDDMSGPKVGPRVAVLLPNSDDFVVLVHAVAKAGAVLVPLNARLTAREMAWQLHDVGASVLVHDDTYADAARAVMDELGEAAPRLVDVSWVLNTERGGVGRRGAESVSIERVAHGGSGRETFIPDFGKLRTHVALDEVHSIVYTSGTTGKPKGAMLTFGNHWWSATSSMLNLGLASGDRWLACMPLFHVGGLSILLRSVIYGIAVILHDRFDAEAVNRAIDEEGVSLLSAVAVMVDRMLDARGDASYPDSLRAVLLGGGPAPEPLLRRAMEAGMPVLQTYGLTETATQVATLAPTDALRKLGSAGKPLFATELRIVDEDENGQRRWASPGEAGEIVVRGPTVTAGYWRRPDATAEKLKDGWFHTGDIGYVDDDGYLYVLDRRDDMFVSGGENVYPAEIEAVLREHDAVAEAAVIGVPDDKWGRVPAAAIVVRDGAAVSEEELIHFCRTRLAGYKVPKVFAVVDVLPRNAAGKVMRRKLADTFRPRE